MGNCAGRNKASMVWANDDDWESTEGSKGFPNRAKQRLLGENSSTSASSSSEPCGREVKIKITKQQLRELLGNVDQVQSMPVEQVLSSLVDRSDRFEIQHQRSWRPSLQSIPEVDQ
ncbi:hypothetical protein RHMOL_Rhmol13G0192900 [Rhododendron molle]|uniref:Uncharacterized protein n=1 Tax=Rhododendron molle TaxID=49168 RepID=A0ACC0L8V6_RHOML|nr:hypothetical protein RHMOL_Rhmol13G0192900 [Rhododendron molle]